MKNKKILKIKLTLEKEIFEDKDIETGSLIGNILIEKMNKELKNKNRQISKIKQPIEIICKIKTEKICE